MPEREELRLRRTTAAALVVGLPVLLFLASLLYARREPAVPPSEPEPIADAATVPGWVGALEAPGGGRLLARLSRLHASELRQAFDRDALARRFGLGTGEPWRLVLRFVSEEGAGELALGRIAVEDAGGEALGPIRRTPEPGADAVGDPLATLLAPPERLRAGAELSLVLWGRAPAPGGVRLRGFERADEVGGAALALDLERRSLAPEPDETALASLEQREPASTALEQGEAAQGIEHED